MKYLVFFLVPLFTMVSQTIKTDECKPFYLRLLDKRPERALTDRELFERGILAYDKKDWKDASKSFRLICSQYPQSPLSQDAWFYAGVCDFENLELERANRAFTQYLNYPGTPQYFEEAIYYKYCIAECIRGGERNRIFGSKQLPKWMPAHDLGLTLFDEVITAMPGTDLGAKALFGKACIHWQIREYKEAIDTFQVLQRRFPKHELTPESYLMQMSIYLEEAELEFQNPDILAFADLTLKKFTLEFPRDERLPMAEHLLHCTKETYARGLYEMGCFYERKCRPQAAAIYYEKAIVHFPETKVAERSRAKLGYLAPHVLDQFDVILPGIEIKESKPESDFEFEDSFIEELEI
jgi:outer membrane protein assembly factor BamD (BamD/ComL family)